MSPKTDSAEDKLHELIEAVPDLSLTSTSKFNDLRSWLADVLGISPSDSIAIYYVSKAGNLKVRFRPGSINSPKVLGVAVLENEGELSNCIGPASLFIPPSGHIGCMVLCSKSSAGRWSLQTVISRGNSPLAARIHSAFPGVTLRTVVPNSPATATQSPAGSLSAVPLVTDARTLRMLQLAIASAPAVMLVGPPGTGKSTLLEKVISEIKNDPSAYGFGHEPDAKWVTPDESWTARELVGGETVDEKARLRFRPGHVLDAIQKDQWLVLDEANRADMDKIFGGLLTWLAGHSVELGKASTAQDAPSIELGWSGAATSQIEGVDRLSAEDVGKDPIRYLAGGEWRLLGTYNALDAQRVFRFGQALGRRFVRVPVPAMSADEFRQALAPQLTDLPAEVGSIIAGIYAAHRESNVAVLGPALFFWMPQYIRKAVELPGLANISGDLEPTQIRSLVAEAYVSSAGVWLSRLDETDMDQLRTRIAPLISEQEWTWLINLLPSLG